MTPLEIKSNADIADYEDSTVEPDAKQKLEMSAVSYFSCIQSERVTEISLLV